MLGKQHKLNMTRPEFLSVFFNHEIDSDAFTFHELSKLLPNSHDLIYCTYTALMEANIYKSDIEFANPDDENVVVLMVRDKSTAKRIKKTCNKEVIRIGSKQYKIKIEVADHLVYISITLTNPDEYVTFMDMNQYSNPVEYL